MFDYRKLLETPCSDCIIDVVAWPAKYSDRPDSGDINVGLISGHDYHHFKSWRGKLERIRQVLIIASLQEAAEVAFPKQP